MTTDYTRLLLAGKPQVWAKCADPELALVTEKRQGQRRALPANTCRLCPQGSFLKVAAHEWLLSANGEVRYTLNTSRSNGRFRGIIEFR